MDRVLIFANPIAGRGRGAAVACALADRLHTEGFDVSLLMDRLDRIDCGGEKPVRAAIIVGGDGTLRHVAGRMLESCSQGSGVRGQKPALTTDPQTLTTIPPLLIVPMGTANLMGRHLGIAWSSALAGEQIVQTLRRGRTVYLDAATANGELFLLMAGVGIDGWVIHELDRLRRGPIRVSSYVMPVLRALVRYDFPPISVTVDGRLVFGPQPGMAFVGNVREYGTGFPILPHARSDDDLLDVCVLPCASRARMCTLALAAAAGRHLRAGGVVYLKGKHVRIESPRPVPAQADGEAAGFTPLDISLLPQRIPFIVPGAVGRGQ